MTVVHASTTTRDARRLLAVAVGLFALAVALSLALRLRSAEELPGKQARLTGRLFYRAVVGMRRWNAFHGGVYVPVTATLQPNRYLEDPDRDVVTTGGERLTKVNPAFMTRLLGGHTAREGISLHITSLRPIRPENAPDPWERDALESFERGVAEATAVVREEKGTTYRYMAPLPAEGPCLKCHARQGYREGDVRGGISVSFDYGPFLAAWEGERRQILRFHGVLLAAGLAVLALVGVRMLRSARRLEEAMGRVRTLEGILPICMVCKKIRREGAPPRDPASWLPVESYISGATDALFSHGCCPDCARDLLEDTDRAGGRG